jgi:hypothetical protein
LKEGSVFSTNQYTTYYVVDKGMWTKGDELIVLVTDNKDCFSFMGYCFHKDEAR